MSLSQKISSERPDSEHVINFYTRHTGDFLTQASVWILIIVVVVLVQLIQEFGLYLAKKLDKRKKVKWKISKHY